MSTSSLAKAGTFTLGGTTPVTRLGYGSMQLDGAAVA